MSNQVGNRVYGIVKWREGLEYCGCKRVCGLRPREKLGDVVVAGDLWFWSLRGSEKERPQVVEGYYSSPLDNIPVQISSFPSQNE